MEEELRILLGRHKRSANGDGDNATVAFYGTIDEINEDTIKNLNSTGTIEAHKVNAREMGKTSRRADVFDNNNATDVNALHIQYNKPHELERHIAENKIDSIHPPEDKINGLAHEEIHKILGNYSQMIKNQDLSKLVVNELTRGSERIGDKNVVPVSNITFTPENDTLTAMTFIAGNLLNKLWDMEKDANEGSYETEELKHEKIHDLLELFKEPLSLRQEIFLKNALEKLSRVIDTTKDMRNISVCATIENSETTNPDNNNCTEKSKIMSKQDSSKVDTKSKRFENRSKANADAFNKINEVLNLMKQYEHLQEKISILRSRPESNVESSTMSMEKTISVDENTSLNLFGKLLDKITKLLSPNKNSKMITKRIQKYNILRKDDMAKKNFENIFNINLTNTTLSTKDKMIVDYLTNIEKHPSCFFTHLQKPLITPLSNVEGSILYNLSEFFKIKSLTDLLNIATDKSDTVKSHSISPTTSMAYPFSTKQRKTMVTRLKNNQKMKNSTVASAKEKLKNDIKVILQDLFDLQKEHGVKSKSNVNIADALPCLYNMLKSDNDMPKFNSKSGAASSNSFNKIKSFIDSLKLDLKFMTLNRRSNTNILPRPRSAVVWERAINNLYKKIKKPSRRYFDENFKSYKDIREMMDKVESLGNTYKNFAIQSGAAPSERLIILKTLQADLKQYINVLEAINKSLPLVTNLPADKLYEFDEFVDNTAINVNLNKKLFAIVNKFKESALRDGNTKLKGRTMTDSSQPLLMVPKWIGANENNNFKLKRDQIIRQLIMNRLRLYIKTKERTESDLNANANYNIAKRILFHLLNGNVALAKELYKVFLANKQNTSDELSKVAVPEYHRKVSPKSFTLKEPSVRVEDPKTVKMLSQDYFLKQLWNLKELQE